MQNNRIPKMGRDMGYPLGCEVSSIRDKAARLRELENQRTSLDVQIQQAKDQIKYSQDSCSHPWNEPRKCSHTVPGHEDPGDPPGTMGIDRRLPTYVDPVVTTWWERSCPKCGLIERTQDTKPATDVVPVFH